MALDIQRAKRVTREVTVWAGVAGLPDRVFVVTMSAAGLVVKEKGMRTVRSLTWRQLLGLMVLHAPEREV